MTHIDKYLCICDEEMCYCSELVPTQNEACSQCARGWHVLFPDMEREHKVRKPRTIVVSGDPYPVAPTSAPATTRRQWVELGLAIVLFIVTVIALSYWAVQ